MKAAVPCYYHLDVEVSPERVGQVRRILAAHLRYWNLEFLVESVCRCAEALLHTIEEHAADKNTTIEMWWNGQHLITAVSDNDQDIRPHNTPQGCLAQIAALSDGWGCCATGAAWQDNLVLVAGPGRRTRPAGSARARAQPARGTQDASRAARAGCSSDPATTPESRSSDPMTTPSRMVAAG